MKKITIAKLILLITGTVFIAGCQSKQAVHSVPAQELPVTTAIVAEGKLLPAQTVELSFFPVGGIVENVNFSEGDFVKKGDILANLEVTPQQTAAVTAAEFELVNAINARQNFLDQSEVFKTQSLLDVTLAKERLNDASDKKRDKEYTYRFSQTREATIERDKAIADFNLATQQLAYAEAKAAKWNTGPDPDQLSILDARVKNARDQLKAANALITTQSVITAPFDSQIVAANILPYQNIQSGVPVITLANINSWIVETTDLKEVNVSSIKPGTKATIRVDAIPGVDFPAEVSFIQPLGVDHQGDMTYKITLTIAADSRFLWNMTTSVVFE